MAGFYDPFTKQLIVRKEPPPATPRTDPDPPEGAPARASDENLRLVLAHRP